MQAAFVFTSCASIPIILQFHGLQNCATPQYRNYKTKGNTSNLKIISNMNCRYFEVVFQSCPYRGISQNMKLFFDHYLHLSAHDAQGHMTGSVEVKMVPCVWMEEETFFIKVIKAKYNNHSWQQQHHKLFCASSKWSLAEFNFMRITAEKLHTNKCINTCKLQMFFVEILEIALLFFEKLTETFKGHI